MPSDPDRLRCRSAAITDTGLQGARSLCHAVVVHAVAAITRGWGGGVVAGWVFVSDLRLHPVATTTSIVGIQANRHAFVFI
jgi:hypothetical protein